MVFSFAISILESPIGDSEGCREKIEDRMATVYMCWEKLLEIQDPQVALHLVRLCASSCSLLYPFRTIPPHKNKPQAEEFDLEMRRVIENLHGGMPDSSWNCTTFPFHRSGIGLTSAAFLPDICYVASIHSIFPKTQVMLKDASYLCRCC